MPMATADKASDRITALGTMTTPTTEVLRAVPTAEQPTVQTDDETTPGLSGLSLQPPEVLVEGTKLPDETAIPKDELANNGAGSVQTLPKDQGSERPDPPGLEGGEGCNKCRDPDTGMDW